MRQEDGKRKDYDQPTTKCSYTPRTPMPTTPRRQADMCALHAQGVYLVLPREGMKRSRILLYLAGLETRVNSTRRRKHRRRACSKISIYTGHG